MASLQYTNPFVGLRAFEESEDYLFFGRGKEIDDLIKKFSGSRFLAVIGSSGSGKSSLVKSGMLPQIYGGFLKSGGNWRVALMQPGENPIGYLAAQLAKEGVLYQDTSDAEIPYEAVIESRLRRSEHGLQHAYSDAHLPEGENLLIVVDQFEELFRFSKYEKDNKLGTSDAMHFVQILLTASASIEYPIYVLLTMRSDFLGDCAEFRGLPEAINVGQYLVPRMTRDEIREAITGPVAVSGATISQRLITRLLNDINNDTDQLPILQHSLMRTWDAWHKRGQPASPIDFEDYEKIGTMATALSQHADEAYSELAVGNEQKICEMMFKALTDSSSDSRGVRRPKSITDLCIITGATQVEIKRMVEVFRKPGRTFLMPPHGVELRDDTIIDISHESLMRVWIRLFEWTKEEARSGSIYIRTATSAELWENGQRGLLKDPELSIAQKWREDNNPTAKWAEGFQADFDKTMHYLEQSRVVDTEEKRVLKNKRRNLIYRLVGGVVVAAICAVGGFFLAAFFQNRATEIELAAIHEREMAQASQDSLKKRINVLQAKFNGRIGLSDPPIAPVDSPVQIQPPVVVAQPPVVVPQPPVVPAPPTLVNIYKNASSEYARLIREGPVNGREIAASQFEDKLAAYTAHFETLGSLIANTRDQDAVERYNNVKDRLYYNNDLYQKLYACMDASSRQRLFSTNSYRGSFNGDFDARSATQNRVKEEVEASGRQVRKIIGDGEVVLCATNDNWIHVYRITSGSPVLENRIPMGTQITALDYNADKKIIYFGLKSGNVGYIEYGKNKKNQPVFENYLGSPVVAIQQFRTEVEGRPTDLLLVAGEKSKVIVYKLEPGSLQPGKDLFGNTLPKKDLGILTNAQFDGRLGLVVLRGRSRTGSDIYYTWDPFTANALEVYRKEYRADEQLMGSTKIY